MIKISIIIPCYNQAEFLHDCINSLKSQAYENWEAILVDDGSTDNSFEIASEHAAKDKRISVVRQVNKGLSGARNTGIKHATGNWVQFLDADDYLLPRCLELVTTHIISNENTELLQGGHDLVDKQCKLIQHFPLSKQVGLFWPYVINGNPGPVHSFFIKRDLLMKAGFFDETLTSVEDWDFWIRVGKLGAELEVLSTPLVAYRYLSNSMSRNPWRMYENNVRVIERINSTDERISIQKVGFNDAKNDLRSSIKIRLIQSIGLCVMQGKIDEALERFRMEGRKYHLEFTPGDFKQMNSFMTFKNFVRKDEVIALLEKYPPQFASFFSKTYFTPSFQEASLFHVFISHHKKLNHQQFGIFGRWKNWKLDNKRRTLDRNFEKGY